MADHVIGNNYIIFVLKKIGVSTKHRENNDKRYVESFTCDELEKYINNNPGCALFETLRNEEFYSNVRVFFDVDMDGLLEDRYGATCDFVNIITKFIADYAYNDCKIIGKNKSKEDMINNMKSNFSITESTNKDKTSFHLIFFNCYTTLDTLINMRKKLLMLIRESNNRLVKAIDTAVYRHKPSLRIVGTRKTQDSIHIHKKTKTNSAFKNYLFTYVDYNEENCYYFINDTQYQSPDLLNWKEGYIPFHDAIKKICKVIGNSIMNLKDITPENFTVTPLDICYTTPCNLCKKASHKHPHHLLISNDCIRIYKSGNPNSCKIKTIPLEGNKLFSISQQIIDLNVINISDRGEYVVWLKDVWRLCDDDTNITKLILYMRDHLSSDCTDLLLCPRNRKVIEHNLKDMLIDAIETDIYPEKLQFLNGVYDINNSIFYQGNEAKEFICTVSTGYKYDPNLSDDVIVKELMSIIDDIQPKTAENSKNRELYEQILSSCLMGTTKQCIFFFYGETATGKSTTKKLLKSVMNNLFLETGQVILTEQMDKGPNPFISNMHLKRVVFCSELPDFNCNTSKKIRADNIKKLTESCIVGRSCYSNKINNRNHATIIIDTNYKPVFDKVDNAIMRRIALVNFKTHFTNSKKKVYSNKYDFIKPLNESLDSRIQSNYYRYAFLKILLGWFQKYHVPNMTILPTPDKIPDFKFRLKVDSLIIPSSSTHIKYMKGLLKLGYMSDEEGIPVLDLSTFQQKIGSHFNIKAYGQDIESFIIKNKKYMNLTDEYLSFIFIEDLNNINESRNT
ncbi:DNA replication NTPase [Turkeypox virus]|uniref:DNA replication NTPase n=1 Tax=Turkeypox virus TaxID=336486 RepID=A0A0M3ZRM6_9POXV|nr:DNA replication NTPase [Turkeypox virus]ALA62409.1 DNA replication NTPase [Turkeypox virus]